MNLFYSSRRCINIYIYCLLILNSKVVYKDRKCVCLRLRTLILLHDIIVVMTVIINKHIDLTQNNNNYFIFPVNKQLFLNFLKLIISSFVNIRIFIYYLLLFKLFIIHYYFFKGKNSF